MNYSALIQNRKSVREFTDQSVPSGILDTIREYFHSGAKRLIPEIRTGLAMFGSQAKQALEGAAGYEQFLIGAPDYLVLLSEAHPLAHINAGFLMEDLILKLQDLGVDSCWITFTDSDQVKNALGIDAPLQVAAIAAIGYGKKTTRRLRLNILSMSNVDIRAKRHYFEPKRSIRDLVYVDTWSNSQDLNNRIGFFDDMLWEALYAASLSPSYLNRQAYGFLLRSGSITLVKRPDAYTTQLDGDLSLGAMLLHFTAVAENWMGRLPWRFVPDGDAPTLPEGHSFVAVCSL